MKRQRVVVTVLVAVVAFLSGGWLMQHGAQGGANVYQKARLFDDVLTYVAEYYVDSLPEPKLYDMAIDGMLGGLKDPYTTYLRESDYKDLELATTGNYGGVGMQIDVRDGWITVVAPIAGTPAEEQGIQSGDQVVQIDGHSTRGFDNDKAVKQLRGPAGTQVKLTVVRPGIPDSLHFDITRAHIHVRSVQYAGLLGGGDVGYVSLAGASISENTADELAHAVDSLRQRGAKSLLLDLRGNPGGILDQGVEVSDLFLNPGDAVVETRGRAPGATQTYSDDHKEHWPGMPVVVLVDGGTASAAEIIAGALQDHDRALLLGSATFGKGLVQTVYPLNGREFLKMTTGRWYTPSGRSIQRPMHDIMLEEETGEAPVDTAAAANDTSEIYHTSGGRVVRGGGGIHPDIVARGDTLTDAEKAFARALGSKIPAYRDVLTAYALQMKADDGVKRPGFAVTAAMRAELERRMRARGISLPDSVWRGAQQLIDEQMSYEITRYVFGRPAEFARRLSDDSEVKEAVGLLEQAQTPKQLLALAQAKQVEHN
jgi:carboxyl-terminal processing protease